MGGSGHPVYPRLLPASVAVAAHAPLSWRCAGAGGVAGGGARARWLLGGLLVCAAPLFLVAVGFFFGEGRKKYAKLSRRRLRVTCVLLLLLLKPPVEAPNQKPVRTGVTWRALYSPVLEQLSEQPHNHRSLCDAVAGPAESTCLLISDDGF